MYPMMTAPTNNMWGSFRQRFCNQREHRAVEESPSAVRPKRQCFGGRSSRDRGTLRGVGAGGLGVSNLLSGVW